MPRNGSGSYSLPANSWNPPVNGTPATPADWTALASDIETALTGSVAADGQTPMAGNLPMGNNRVTGMADATSLTDAASAGQVQNGSLTYLTGVAGTNTITASATGLSAYATGETFRFIAAGANTGAATLNVNSVGAKAITKNGSIALASGDIQAGDVVTVCYDGTRFQLGRMQLPGTILDRAYGEYTANTNLTTALPVDDTTPLITEGTQIISVSITPKTTTSRLRVRFQCYGAVNTIESWGAAIFEGSTCRGAAYALTPTANYVAQLVIEKEWVPGVTTALTLSVRVGPSTGTMRLNGSPAGRAFNNQSAATLVVEEIAA